mmetsp:Transcript_54929/g.134677  ORF Transcript_54929/g.134677 Transcript_54929/m.134677 type:complete len:271 (+) Transcript_54929:183-995(+)
MDPVIELSERFRVGVPLLKDGEFEFSGQDAVKWLVTNVGQTEVEDALRLGTGLMRLGIFTSVDRNSTSFTNDRKPFIFTAFWREEFPSPNPISGATGMNEAKTQVMQSPRDVASTGKSSGRMVVKRSGRLQAAPPEEDGAARPKTANLRPKRNSEQTKTAAVKRQDGEYASGNIAPLARKDTFRGMVCSIEEMAQRLKKGVEIKDRRHHMRVFKDSFLGSDALNFLVTSDLAINEFEAADLGADMIRSGLIAHVTNGHKTMKPDNFYRFL